MKDHMLPEQHDPMVREAAPAKAAGCEQCQSCGEALRVANEKLSCLREHDARYRASFEGASVGQALVGLDGRFEEVNQALALMLGYPSDELRGRTFAELTHPEDVGVSITARDALLRGEAPCQRLEKRYLRKDGGTIWVEVSVAPLRDISGRPRKFITHVIDISARKQTECDLKAEIAARQRAEIELRHAQKLEAIGRLAAGIAHEINTPTQFVGDNVHFIREAVEGILRLMSKYRAAAEAAGGLGEGAALLDEIRSVEEEIELDFILENLPRSLDGCGEGIARIATIVRSMKDFAHADQREQSPADINQAISTTLVVARNEYKYFADVETEFDGLPPVVCHPGDINQVLLNLIVNAAHAIEEVLSERGGRGRIHIRTLLEGDWVRIDVADNGAGMLEEAREHIFEPFFTTKPVGKGTGQGLAIARSIVVEKHGGSLSFQSARGKGTTFTVRLPVEGMTRREAA
jgi:two-component system NtrC family sensor kinase